MIKEENGNGARLKLTAGSRPGFNVYGNTNKHDKLKNLEYEKSGHTGFQKELTFDEFPTKDSKNPITSGGVYNAIKDIPGGGSSDVDLSDYVKKEDGYGLSATRYVSEVRFYDTVTNTDTFGGIGYETQNGEYYEIYLYNQEQMDEKLSEKAATSAVEALYNETMEIRSDMFLKQDIVDVRYAIDEPEYVYSFGYTHNTDTRLDEAYTTSISFAFNNNVYVDDYISGLSFYSGETPTRIDYTNSGILNWVGTDCSDNNGYSIFKPEPNKHYDIVFYFNGRQFIGLVNGFVPSLGNVVV